MTERGSVDQSRILLAGVLAVIVSVAAVLIVRALLYLVLDLPSPADFPPLSIGQVVFLTAVLVALSVGVFAIVVRRAKDPVRTYLIIAAVALVLSFVPNIGLLNADPADLPMPMPGLSTTAVVALMILHVVAAVVSVWILISQSRSK